MSWLTLWYDQRHDTLRLWRPDKNIDFPQFSDRFIATPERHNTSQINSEQLRCHDYVAIVSWLRHNASQQNFDVVMRRNLRRDSEKIKKT